jgi:hypothetical protein
MGEKVIAIVKVLQWLKHLARSLTKELMDSPDQHIASEIIEAKPGRTPRGYAEKLLKERKKNLPKVKHEYNQLHD